MILWFCSGVALLSAVVATYAKGGRRPILALWAVGLGVGGVYLELGAELLAIIQWIVSTLVVIGLIVYSATFGELAEGRDSRARPSARGARVVLAILPLCLGGLFTATIWYASRDLNWNFPGGVPAENGMAAIGSALVTEHLLPLEIFGLTLLLAIVGAGVIARPAGKFEDSLEVEK